MSALNKTVKAALQKIIDTGRVSQDVATKLGPMGLIEVNTGDIDQNDMAACRLTQKGLEGMGKNTNTNAASTGSKFALIDNAVLPESKRGFGRKAGESKYPFADMNLGQSFFVSNDEVEGGDALKKLTSTVSNMNNRYRTETGEMQTVTRTVRGEGNKAVLNEDGSKRKETKQVPVYKQDRKFSIRAVEAGKEYGGWKAPANGALIARVL